MALQNQLEKRDNERFRSYFEEKDLGDYSPGRFAWLTDNCRSVKPFPVVGQQGLFNVDDELIEFL